MLYTLSDCVKTSSLKQKALTQRTYLYFNIYRQNKQQKLSSLARSPRHFIQSRLISLLTSNNQMYKAHLYRPGSPRILRVRHCHDGQGLPVLPQDVEHRRGDVRRRQPGLGQLIGRRPVVDVPVRKHQRPPLHKNQVEFIVAGQLICF